METFYTFIIFVGLLAAIAVPYWRGVARRRKKTEQKHQAATAAGLTAPATLHPRIDMMVCIGCASCVRACPEDVLGIVDGKAAIVNGMRCVGHALCAEACPVGGITMGFGKPRQGMEIPFCDESLETNVSGLYIAGELGGLGLIRNAFEQGTRAVNAIAAKPRSADEQVFDVAVIGAGPAGMAAALAAVEHRLRYIVFEQGDVGGSILHYPRQKLILSQPASLPLHGALKKSELSKEELLALFMSLAEQYSLQIRTQCTVRKVERCDDKFTISTEHGETYARHVILALGRRGTPRKLGVPGEELTKVAYQLIEAESFTGKKILVVGGGDSAVEAAIGLSRQKGNTVTMSYRRNDFVRLKERNDGRIRQAMKDGSVRMIFNSNVTAIAPLSVELAQESGESLTLPNDFVFIFAGGELPTAFLQAAGVTMRTEETA